MIKNKPAADVVPMTAKREQPILADWFIIANPNKIIRPDVPRIVPMLRTLQARVRASEKIIFDIAASIRVGEVLRDIPDLIVEQMQSARAPFERCWIEYDAEAVWRTVTNQPAATADLSRDKEVGLLVDHGSVNVFMRSFNGTIGMLPLVYHLHTEWPLADQLRFAEKLGVSRTGIDRWMWGSVSEQLRQRNPGYLRALRDTSMVELLGSHFGPNVYHGAAGDFRNVVGFLLMLNQPRVTQYLRVPSTRGWVGNKPRPFLEHNTVTMALDAKSQLVRLAAGEGVGDLRRRHRVRGHYCHDETARTYMRIAGCVHDWTPTEADWTPALTMPVEEREHWVCRACDGKRWWRVQHERGDASKGFVDHSAYLVRAVEQARRS